MYFTGRHGRENLREMKKGDFVLKQDARGRRFYQKKAQYETKNHRGEDIGNDEIGLTKLLTKIYTSQLKSRLAILLIFRPVEYLKIHGR